MAKPMLILHVKFIDAFAPLRIFNAQSNVAFSVINAHKVGVLNEKGVRKA
jgi:hypothetical protein